MQTDRIYERTPRGILALRGTDRHSFLQGMVSNDVLALAPGQSRHAALLDSTGHILADLYVHAFPDALQVETDPTCLATLHSTLDKFLIMEDVQITDASDQWAIIAVYGNGPANAFPAAAVRPTAFSIAPGVDLWLPAAEKAAVWESLLASGATLLSADDAEALRVDAGIPKWSRELTPAVLLPEAEMADAVSYTKGCYVGQEVVARLQARGHTNRALRQILLAEDAPVPPIGATIHVPEDGPEPGREIGRITSAAASPSRGGRALALGYVRKEYFAHNTPISVQIEQPGGLMFSYAGVVQEIPAHAAN